MRVEYAYFNAEVKYVCPKCGKTSYCSLEPEDIYAIYEFGLDGECASCGEKLRLEG